MKPSTKIILSAMLVTLSLVCVALFFMLDNSSILVLYNPVTNVTEQIKIESGQPLSKYISAAKIDGYKFLDYYYSSDFSTTVDIDKTITHNTTVVLGYCKSVSDINQASANVAGIKFIGSLDQNNLNELLGKNYKYLDLGQSIISGTFAQNNTSLKTLILPEGNVSNINNYTNLETVSFRGTTLVQDSFNNCDNLTNVNLVGCQQIKDSFNNCSKLKNITIPQTLNNLQSSFINTHLDSISNNSNNFLVENGILYQTSNDQIVAKKAINSLINLSLNGNTTKVDSYAFYKHANIKNLSLNAKVDFIGEYAFAYSGLKDINIIQNNVLTISFRAFSNCLNLKNINFGKGVQTIGQFAFCNTSIEQLNFENSVISLIEQYAFYNCDNLISARFIDNQVTLSKGCFSGCDNLQSIANLNTQILPEKVFENCKKLSSLINLSNIKSIQNYAFLNCTNLTDITELATIQTAQLGAFENCTSLVQAKFLDLENIPENLFLNCTSLTDFVSAQNITQFNASAFDGCNSLQNLSFLSDKYLCEDGVVYNAEQTQILFYLPTKTTTTFTIKSTVTSIYHKYLAQNKNLQSFYNTSTQFYVKDGVLFSADKQTLICYPGGKTDVSYTVPSYVKIIEKDAFIGCSKLKRLTINNNVEQLKNGFLNPNLTLTTLYVDFIGESINNLQTSFLGWFFGANSYTQNNQYVPTTLIEVVVNNQTQFGSGCFYDCTNLLTVIIQNCGKVASHMFYGCYLLQTISIDRMLEEIDEYALYNCMSLVNINFVYNPDLTLDDIKLSALINTPRGVRVTVYSASVIQLDLFSRCFRDKQVDWAWRNSILN